MTDEDEWVWRPGKRECCVRCGKVVYLARQLDVQLVPRDTVADATYLWYYTPLTTTPRGAVPVHMLCPSSDRLVSNG